MGIRKMAAVVTHDAVAADSVRNGDRNSGSGVGQSSSNIGPPHRRIRKAIIESDPEDDEEMSVSVSELPSDRSNTNLNVKETQSPSINNSIRNGSKRIESSSETNITTSESISSTDPNLPSSGVQPAALYTMDTDISQLEAPTFTTLDRGPSQTMIDLTWDHKVNLIGKKVVNPMIHNCDKCKKPILIYGRMIPCKHVFCLSCATQSLTPSATSTCPRCGDKVVRVEQAGLGSIYMCSHGGSRYGSNGCRRTYLSQRDLQAHIQHRHMKQQQQSAFAGTTSAAAAPNQLAQQNSHSSSNQLIVPAVNQLPSAQEIAAATAAIVANRKRQEHQQHPAQSSSITPVTNMTPQHSHTQATGYQQFSHPPPHQGTTTTTYPYNTPAQVKHQQSNLITVPIQDSASSVTSGAVSTVASYGSSSQSGLWNSQAASAASGYPTTASSFYHTGHPHHSSHHQSHHQGSATGQIMSSNIQWTSQPNNRTSGVDRTSSNVEHVRGSGERTSGGYRR